MISKITFICLVLIIFLLQSCESVTNQKQDQESEILVKGEMSISCPLSVYCDENFDYRAYSGLNDSVGMYMSFEPAFSSNRSFESAKEAFKYLYFYIYHPSLFTDSSIFYHGSSSIIRAQDENNKFTDFSNDTLYGEVTYSFDNMTEEIQSRDPNCSSGDILGICYQLTNAPITYTIKYAFKLNDSDSSGTFQIKHSGRY